MASEAVISYEQFFRKPVKERIQVFNEISADNRALLIKAQTERWLSVNHRRLSPEQIAVIEEVIRSISPEWFKSRRGSMEIAPEADKIRQKLETVLSREEITDLATERAKYIPAVTGEGE